jgi:transcription antitermination factor NusG
MTKSAPAPAKWYAVYTYPQAEKKVYNRVNEMGFESYLPVHTVVRQWSDRKKKMEVPLFPNYVFVRTHLPNTIELLSIRELVKFISFDGAPVVIPEKEIEAIRQVLSGKAPVENETYDHRVGETVVIRDGQFAGTQGLVVRKNGKHRLVIRIHALHQAISVEIATQQLATP